LIVADGARLALDIAATRAPDAAMVKLEYSIAFGDFSEALRCDAELNGRDLTLVINHRDYVARAETIEDSPGLWLLRQGMRTPSEVNSPDWCPPVMVSRETLRSLERRGCCVLATGFAPFSPAHFEACPLAQLSPSTRAVALRWNAPIITARDPRGRELVLSRNPAVAQLVALDLGHEQRLHWVSGVLPPPPV
jgi:hypothetical protein